MTKIFRFTFYILTSTLLLLVGGCGPFWVDPYIVVKESPLNWVHIQYYNLSKQPVRRTSVYLSGTGYAEIKRGVSEQISNDFAKGYNKDTWDKLQSYRVQIEPEHVRNIMQNLVNHGLLDKEKTGKKSKKDSFDRFIAVKANVCNNTYSDNVNMFEADPDLAEQLLDVVREFENPTR